MFKSLKKLFAGFSFFLRARKYTEKRVAHLCMYIHTYTHVARASVAPVMIQLHVDTMCNFIIFFRLGSLTRHGKFERIGFRSLSRQIPRRAVRWKEEFNEFSEEQESVGETARIGILRSSPIFAAGIVHFHSPIFKLSG